MLNRLFAHPFAQITTILLVAWGIIVCISPHVVPQFSWVVNYAVQLMLLYMGGGIFFLFLKQPKLTFVCFGGCLFLCFYLKYSTKNNYIDRWRNAVLESYQTKEEVVKLKTGLFNLSNASDQSAIAKVLRESDADVLSIHEVTPVWELWLEDSLRQEYPYHHTMVDIGLFGMAIYSRFPLASVDTFYYDGIPNLRTCFKNSGDDFCLISVHTEPALNESSRQRLEGHLETIVGQITRMDGMPLIVTGDFNAVSWSNELQKFMERAGLLQSRSGFMDIQRTIGYVPIDHIFHSPRLACSDFVNFSDKNGNHLGIMSTFQVNNLATHVKKTAQ